MEVGYSVGGLLEAISCACYLANALESDTFHEHEKAWSHQRGQLCILFHIVAMAVRLRVVADELALQSPNVE